MTISEKLEYAKRHVESLARHDDEPVAARAEALAELKAHADAELAAAKKRGSPKKAGPDAPTRRRAKKGK